MRYKLRNLPCSDALGKAMPWSVYGNHRETRPDGTTINGQGVLEWCWDRQDAVERLRLMRQDSRFSNLTIRQEV